MVKIEQKTESYRIILVETDKIVISINNNVVFEKTVSVNKLSKVKFSYDENEIMEIV